MKNRTLLLVLFLIGIWNAFGQDPLALPENIEPEDRICFALYTVNENTLKLTAQFYTNKNFEPFEATLEIEENGINPVW